MKRTASPLGRGALKWALRLIKKLVETQVVPWISRWFRNKF